MGQTVAQFSLEITYVCIYICTQIHMAMDEYPAYNIHVLGLGLWTSINFSCFDVNYRLLKCSLTIIYQYCILTHIYRARIASVNVFYISLFFGQEIPRSQRLFLHQLGCAMTLGTLDATRALSQRWSTLQLWGVRTIYNSRLLPWNFENIIYYIYIL